MSVDRKRCFETMVKSDCEIVLVTPNNLSNFILGDAPLHQAYQYLSPIHKSDYLRCYFMHHYGAGYSDIKETLGSWSVAFEDMQDEQCYVNGYQEVGPEGVADVGGDLYLELQKNYKKLIGCGLFICKPGTPFTYEWFHELNRKLDGYYPLLKSHPATTPREKMGMEINSKISQYPIPWTDILGNIFHPLCLKYSKHIKQTVPRCLFESYR